MLTRKNLLLTILICCCFSFTALSQQTVQEIETESHYLLYLPKDYNANTENYPLLIFLHGVGERGTDIEKVKTHGSPMLIEKGKEYPFIVVSPQSKTEWKADHVYDLVQHLIEKYKVDENRIHLTGIGYGTWDIAMSYPNTFASIAPICGGGELSRAWRLRHTAVWGFHGAKDEVVPLSASQDMVNAIRECNPEAKLTIYPEVHHDSWVQTYENGKLYDWMLLQKRFSYIEQTIDSEDLAKYTGTFKDNNNNQIIISLIDKSLVCKTEMGKEYKLKSFAKDSFYTDSNSNIEFVFQTIDKDQINELVIMDNNKTKFARNY